MKLTDQDNDNDKVNNNNLEDNRDRNSSNENERVYDDREERETESERSECYLCQVKTNSVCPKCGLPSCPPHLSSHLTADNVCLPFIIKYREGVGRYVVASRDIQPNEVR